MTPELKTQLIVSPVRGDSIIIRPQNLLQVVLVGHQMVRWNNRQSHDPGRIQLKALRSESIQVDGFKRKRRGNFKILPHSHKMHTWQNHYWFRLSMNDIHKMEKLKPTETYELADLSFFHHTQRLLVGELKVLLQITDEDKEAYFDYLSKTVFRNQDPLATEATYVGVGGRYVDEEEGYIFNPGPGEKISFTPDQRSMIIEVAETAKQRFRTRWTITGDELANKMMDVKELPPRTINSTTIQRFQIQNLVNKLPLGMTSFKTGRLLLTVHDENHTRYSKFDRHLNFDVRVSRETEAYYGDSGDECVNRDAVVEAWADSELSPHDTFEFGDNDADSHLATEFGSGLYSSESERKWTEYFRPKKTKVVISEVEFDTLESGEETVKLMDVRKAKRIELTDVSNGRVVSLPYEYELCIVLDRTDDQTWGVQVEGKFLKLDFNLADGNKHRWVFSRKPWADQKGDTDTIRFKWGKKVREITVIKAQVASLDNDWRYSD